MKRGEKLKVAEAKEEADLVDFGMRLSLIHIQMCIRDRNNTALGAKNTKKQEIVFISEAHEKFYYEKLKEVRYQDVGCLLYTSRCV